MCAPEQLDDAALEVLDGGEVQLNDDELLARTRTVAAAHATRRAHGGWRGMLSAERDAECQSVPQWLAAQANGELSPDEEHDLERHLEDCPRCAEVPDRFVEAEQAFKAALARREPSEWLLAEDTGASAGAAAGPAAIAGPDATSNGHDSAAETPASNWTTDPPLSAARAPSPEAAAPDSEATPAPAEAVHPDGEATAVLPVAGMADGVNYDTTAVLPPMGVPAPRRSRPRPLALLGLAVLLLVLGIAGGAFALLSGGSGHKNTASEPHRAPTSAPSGLTPATPPARHRRRTKPARPHRRPHPNPAPAPAPSTSSGGTVAAGPTTPAPAATTPAQSTPAPAPAPAPAPVASPPSGGGGGGGGGGSVSVSQGGSLPAANAPTQGIGGGSGP